MKKTYWMVVTRKGNPVITENFFMVATTKAQAQEDMHDLLRHGNIASGIHVIPVTIQSKEKFR